VVWALATVENISASGKRGKEVRTKRIIKDAKVGAVACATPAS
jgi:hypothetical protein